MPVVTIYIKLDIILRSIDFNKTSIVLITYLTSCKCDVRTFRTSKLLKVNIGNLWFATLTGTKLPSLHGSIILNRSIQLSVALLQVGQLRNNIVSFAITRICFHKVHLLSHTTRRNGTIAIAVNHN